MDERRSTAVAVSLPLVAVTVSFGAAQLLHIGLAVVAGLLTAVILGVLNRAAVDRARPVGGREEPGLTAHRLPGLIEVRPKNSFAGHEWLELLRTAEHEFYIAGHSLGEWCSETNRRHFVGNIRRLVSGGGRVTLVTLDIHSNQLARLPGADEYKRKIRLSLGVLGQLHAELDAPARARLTISALKDHPGLPYMVVGNERRLITGTYLAASHSDAITCLELDRRYDVASMIYNDLHELAKAGVTPAALSSPPGASGSLGSNPGSGGVSGGP